MDRIDDLGGRAPPPPRRDERVAVADDTAGDAWKLAPSSRQTLAEHRPGGHVRAHVKCCGHRAPGLAGLNCASVDVMDRMKFKHARRPAEL
jgi:hypothetical protein